MALTPAQEETLKSFVRECLEAAWEDEYESADVQDLALTLDLLWEDRATQADIEDGFEGDVGDRIYRLVAWLAR